jgi:hypothetical protein
MMSPERLIKWLSILIGNEKGANDFGQNRDGSGKMVKNRRSVNEPSHYHH